MRYNNSFFNENAIKHNAWNWWDYVLTGATGGWYGAVKQTTDEIDRVKRIQAAEEEVYETTKEKAKQEGKSDEEAEAEAEAATHKDTVEELEEERDKLRQWKEDSAAQSEAATEAAETAKQTELAAGELAETEAQQNATTSAIQAQNAGLNKERAGMMGEANLANRSNANNALAGIAASTQADYLNKIGQANALQQQAENMQKGAALNTAGATVSGAAQGLATGASMFGTSDENEKTGCSDLDFIKNYYGNKKKDMTPQTPVPLILEQAQKMFELKAQLDKLKENK